MATGNEGTGRAAGDQGTDVSPKDEKQQKGEQQL